MKIILALVFMFLSLNAHAEYTNDELSEMNLRSLRADFANDTAYSTGTGRIIHDIRNSTALARRAALADAQRGLLILRRELKEGKPRRADSVSGHVPAVKIISERESGDIYVVEVQAVLSELMHEEPINKEGGEDDEYEEHEEYEDCHDDYDYDFPDDYTDEIISRDSSEEQTLTKQRIVIQY